MSSPSRPSPINTAGEASSAARSPRRSPRRNPVSPGQALRRSPRNQQHHAAQPPAESLPESGDILQNAQNLNLRHEAPAPDIQTRPEEQPSMPGSVNGEQGERSSPPTPQSQNRERTTSEDRSMFNSLTRMYDQSAETPRNNATMRENTGGPSQYNTPNSSAQQDSERISITPRAGGSPERSGAQSENQTEPEPRADTPPSGRNTSTGLLGRLRSRSSQEGTAQNEGPDGAAPSTTENQLTDDSRGRPILEQQEPPTQPGVGYRAPYVESESAENAAEGRSGPPADGQPSGAQSRGRTREATRGGSGENRGRPQPRSQTRSTVREQSVPLRYDGGNTNRGQSPELCGICQEDRHDCNWPHEAFVSDDSHWLKPDCALHQFHFECIKRWWAEQATREEVLTCPLCRAEYLNADSMSRTSHPLFALVEHDVLRRLERDSIEPGSAYLLVRRYLDFLATAPLYGGYRAPATNIIEFANTTASEHNLPSIRNWLPQIVSACEDISSRNGTVVERGKEVLRSFRDRIATYALDAYSESPVAHTNQTRQPLADITETPQRPPTRRGNGTVPETPTPNPRARTPDPQTRNQTTPGTRNRTADTPASRVRPRNQQVPVQPAEPLGYAQGGFPIRPAVDQWSEDDQYFIRWEDFDWEVWKIRNAARGSTFELFLRKPGMQENSYQMQMVQSTSIPGGKEVARMFLSWCLSRGIEPYFDPQNLDSNFQGQEPDDVQAVCFQRRRATNYVNAPWCYLIVSYDNGESYFPITFSMAKQRFTETVAREMVLKTAWWTGQIDDIPQDWPVGLSHRAAERARRHATRLGQPYDMQNYQETRLQYIEQFKRNMEQRYGDPTPNNA